MKSAKTAKLLKSTVKKMKLLHESRRRTKDANLHKNRDKNLEHKINIKIVILHNNNAETAKKILRWNKISTIT